MIPGFDLNTFVTTTSAVAVIAVIAAIVFAESGLLIGFFPPRRHTVVYRRIFDQCRQTAV